MQSRRIERQRSFINPNFSFVEADYQRLIGLYGKVGNLHVTMTKSMLGLAIKVPFRDSDEHVMGNREHLRKMKVSQSRLDIYIKESCIFQERTNSIDTKASENNFAHDSVYTRARTASRTHYECEVGCGDVTIDM